MHDKNKKLKNRRITYREYINIFGKLVILYKNKEIEELIHIVNISLNGVEVVFANNNFLLNYLSLVDENTILKINFEFNEKIYLFPVSIKWIRIYNIGEKNFYTLTGLNFLNLNEIKNELIEIILLLQTQNFFLK